MKPLSFHPAVIECKLACYIRTYRYHIRLHTDLYVVVLFPDEFTVALETGCLKYLPTSQWQVQVVTCKRD